MSAIPWIWDAFSQAQDRTPFDAYGDESRKALMAKDVHDELVDHIYSIYEELMTLLHPDRTGLSYMGIPIELDYSLPPGRIIFELGPEQMVFAAPVSHIS